MKGFWGLPSKWNYWRILWWNQGKWKTRGRLAKSDPDTDTTSRTSSMRRIPTPQNRKVNDIISHLQGKSFTEENNQLETMSATNSKPHPNQYVLPVHVSWNTQGLYMKLIAEAVSNLLWSCSCATKKYIDIEIIVEAHRKDIVKIKCWTFNPGFSKALNTWKGYYDRPPQKMYLVS